MNPEYPVSDCAVYGEQDACIRNGCCWFNSTPPYGCHSCSGAGIGRPVGSNLDTDLILKSIGYSAVAFVVCMICLCLLMDLIRKFDGIRQQRLAREVRDNTNDHAHNNRRPIERVYALARVISVQSDQEEDEVQTGPHCSQELPIAKAIQERVLYIEDGRPDT